MHAIADGMPMPMTDHAAHEIASAQKRTTMYNLERYDELLRPWLTNPFR